VVSVIFLDARALMQEVCRYASRLDVVDDENECMAMWCTGRVIHGGGLMRTRLRQLTSRLLRVRDILLSLMEARRGGYLSDILLRWLVLQM
jgi:hypothetical protein